MLYQLYETQRAFLSPFAEFASAAGQPAAGARSETSYENVRPATLQAAAASRECCKAR